MCWYKKCKENNIIVETPDKLYVAVSLWLLFSDMLAKSYQ